LNYPNRNGSQKGVVTFIDENGILRGSIRAMGNTSYFRSGKTSGNSFAFSGNLNTGVFNLRYNAKGTVDGDTLNAVATTNLGTFQMSGTQTK
jgi:hypothetical protein